jgi:hypothetical protein
MLDTAAASSRVGAEFIGLARVFRTGVQAEDRAVDDALNAIAQHQHRGCRRSL